MGAALAPRKWGFWSAMFDEEEWEEGRWRPRREPSETHVVVLMGGWSAEREVSLSSGRAVAEALRGAGYRVTEVDARPDVMGDLRELRPDVVFNALHGSWGEDGKVQGVLETLGIPYTHSGVLASALAMDKHLSKVVFESAGIPVAGHVLATPEELMEGHPLPPPYVVKPVAEGSSVGIFIVRAENEALPPKTLREMPLKNGKVMVERYVPGRELTCAVMGDVALGVLEIVPLKAGFYDYASKYEVGGSKHICPAELPDNVYLRIQQLTVKAHKALGCKGVSRADFRFHDQGRGEGELVILEVNTQPGMTPTSLMPEIAQHAGHSFEELVSWMVDDASVNR